MLVFCFHEKPMCSYLGTWDSTGTKDRLLPQFVTVAQHAVSQQAFGLRIAGGLHLPTDFGHGVQHVQFGSRCCRGKHE